MKTEVFVIVPSFKPTGPIKGAVALCNGLVNELNVSIVPLKEDNLDGSFCIDARIKIISLANHTKWKDKFKIFKNILVKKGGRNNVVTISFAFSAEAFNFFCAPYARIMSSVRGNLFKNYIFDYGKKGVVFAVIHYMLLHRFSKIIAMSKSMKKQLGHFGLKKIELNGNFIDEINLVKYLKNNTKNTKAGGYKFIFLASLTSRKNPNLLIRSIYTLRKKGHNCSVDIIGDGPLRHTLDEQVGRLELHEYVNFYGYLKSPYEILQEADCMVIPSYSEGISRAVMEALFFSVPVILRDVDANNEIIFPNENGQLFKSDNDLIFAMERMICVGNDNRKLRREMLPDMYRQSVCINNMINIINNG